MSKENLFDEKNKPWNARTAGLVPHDTIYYGKCFLGGVLACGSTHLAITPLDVTKCNMQVNLIFLIYERIWRKIFFRLIQ
jgi:hypothetical protein